MIPFAIFPKDLTKPCALHHDIAGWTLTSHAGTHPSNGAAAQVFDLPDDTPEGNGASLTIPGQTPYHGVLYVRLLPTGPGLLVDVYPDEGDSVGSAFAPVSIEGDHFVADGRRWIWRMTTGFCDYKVFLEGGDLRSLLQQNQDCGARGRRVFLNIVNITDFNPDAYGQSFYDRLPEYLALNAEYDQYVELDVLPDTGYRGWSLGKCQDFWARVNDSLDRAPWNHFRSLTNEFDHGGNLVGSPNDYARPVYPLVSQGSAVSDAPPPRPGWGFREFHCAKDFPKVYLFEDELFNGLGVNTDGGRWGDPKPIVYTEGRRFKEDDPITDKKLARTYAYESLALGEGLTLHTDDGKYSRLLGPRQASCVKTAMTILGAA
jgi:hypothetical protein